MERKISPLFPVKWERVPCRISVPTGLRSPNGFRKSSALIRRRVDVRVLSADDCDYGYRTSIFKTEKTDWVVLSVTLALPKVFEPRVAYKELAAVFGDKVPASAKEVASAVKAVRAKKLPDPAQIGNAGSFFKNPVVYQGEDGASS